MREGNLDVMEALWVRARSVTCTHPNSPAIFGRAAVMASWRLILGHLPPDIHAADPQAIITGRTAMVLCREIIGIGRTDGLERLGARGRRLADGQPSGRADSRHRVGRIPSTGWRVSKGV